MGTRPRGANMTTFEDEILCAAYVTVTLNAEVGNNQTNDTFWEAVRVEYHNQSDIVIPRPAGSLQSRFHTISSSVAFYVAKLSHAMNNPESGQSEMDMIIKARSAYQAAKKKAFTFDGCHQILKVLPKFDLQKTAMNHSQASVSSNASQPFIDSESPSERPIGRKAAKLAKRVSDKSIALATAQASLDRAEKADAEYLHYTREGHESRLRMEAKMSEMVDLKLLEMNTSNMNEKQLDIYNMKINELHNRMQQQSSSQSEQSPSE